MQKILGLNHAIENQDTGALAQFHVVEFYSVDLKYRTITATLNGYVNREKYEQGRNALTSHTLTISGIADEINLDLAWLYNQAILPSADSVFAGAKLVYAEEKAVSQAQ